MNSLPLPLRSEGISPEAAKEAQTFLGPLWQVPPPLMAKAAIARFNEVGGSEIMAKAKDAISNFGVGITDAASGKPVEAYSRMLIAAQNFAAIEEKDGFVVSSA